VILEKHQRWLYLRAFVLGLLATSALFGQYTVTCSSENGKRQFCPADTRKGVRLINQRSDSPCIRGRTWGWNQDGIWVDRGCRAEFAIGRGRGGSPPGARPPREPVMQTITCSSEDGKRNWCPNPTNGEVRLVRQLSGSRCRRGSTWGTQPGSVWVDRGCRADFEIRSYR
jgi:Protein of unknown function (DUF3011)